MNELKRSFFPIDSSPLIAYYVVLLLIGATSFLPEYRLWGLSVWSVFPIPTMLMVLTVAILAPVGLVLMRVRFSLDSDESGGHWTILTIGISAAMMVAFILLRAKAFYLGDGYTVLSLLAQPDPLVKARDMGEAYMHIWVKALTGETGETGALLSFRAISFSAGLLTLAAVVAFGRRLFDSSIKQFLFALLVVSSGLMLHFFGYVENYSLFTFTLILFCLVGLGITRGMISRWWAIPVGLIPGVMHVFGVAVLPAMAYLLISGTRTEERLFGLSAKTKLFLGVLGAVAFVAAFAHFWYHYLFFRLAVTPLVSDRFTVDGYWILSPAHLTDMLNLLLILIPALPLLIVLTWKLPWRSLLKQSEYRFMAILAVCCLGEAFLFDPKLGMARDWDLFSFVGVPLLILSGYAILKNSDKIRGAGFGIALAAILGLIVLSPRVIGQTDIDRSMELFRQYTDLDLKKSMYARTLLSAHIGERGDTARAEEEWKRYIADYPAWRANQDGLQLKRSGNCPAAIQKFELAIEHFPLYAAAYTNIAMCLRDMGQFDSSIVLFRIATGMNPFNATIAKDMGAAYLYSGRAEEAEKCFHKSIEIDPENQDALVGLVHIYRQSGRTEEWFKYLTQAAELENPPPGALQELGEHYLKQGDLEKARPVFQRAIARGLDTTYVRLLRENVPQLGL